MGTIPTQSDAQAEFGYRYRTAILRPAGRLRIDLRRLILLHFQANPQVTGRRYSRV